MLIVTEGAWECLQRFTSQNTCEYTEDTHCSILYLLAGHPLIKENITTVFTN